MQKSNFLADLQEQGERFALLLGEQFAHAMRNKVITHIQPARLGDGENPPTVIIPPAKRVPNCQFYVHLEINGVKTVLQVANTNASLTFDQTNANMPILIGKPYGSSVYHIISVDHNVMNNFTGGALPSQIAQKQMLAVTPERWTQIQAQANNTLSLDLKGGFIIVDNTLYALPDTQDFIDMTSYVPVTADKAKWVMVTYTSAGVSVIQGSEFTPSSLPPESAFPSAITAGHVPLFMVYLYTGQTGIIQDNIVPIKTHHILTQGVKIKVSSNDTTAGYLADKLTVGTGLVASQVNDGGDEDYKIEHNFNPLCQGRLTLTSGTPVTISDVTAATTLYFTPFGGNIVQLYDGSNWDTYTFTERSLSLSGLTANTNYDIFIYDSSGTLTLESVAWSSDTARATALATQDGVLVKTGATERRYVGTIRITGTTGQCEDSILKRFVWNAQNRVLRTMEISDTTSHTYTTTSWRYWNNDTTQFLACVIGLRREALWANVNGITSNGGATTTFQRLTLGFNTTTGSSSDCLLCVNTTGAGVGFIDFGRAGYNTINVLEYGGSVTSTMSSHFSKASIFA